MMWMFPPRYIKQCIKQHSRKSLTFDLQWLSSIMNDLFAISKNNYNLRNFQELESSLRRTVKFGTETISYRGPQIWNLIPKRLKTLETLNKLKKKIEMEL